VRKSGPTIRASRPPLPDDVYLKRQRDMVLTTRGRQTGRPHRVTLWFVHQAGRLYLMAYARRHGRGTDWYQNLRRARDGMVEVGDRRFDVEWEAIDDPAAELTNITELFSGKYGRQMVASYYLETKRFPVILRLKPAAA
jgi:deazaflavin-dependent oxidoreductase (nitroreductase family)